jgi:acyl-homoserine-lactone acylase
MRRSTGIILLVVVAALATAVGIGTHGGGSGRAEAASPPPTGGFQATIRRTSHGVPHILANDFAGLGYGYGYALAQDNICVVADTYVTVDAERSRYFGPDASYVSGGNGATNNNLNSDFFYQRIIDDGRIDHLLSLAPPQGPRPEIREGVRGYVAGYNRYLDETGVANLPDPNCRGAEWVHKITEQEVYRRFYQLGLLASAGVAIDGIGAAQPPAGPPPPPASPARQQQMISDVKQKLPLGGVGSNALGLGKDATDNGRGMMLGNPHFPWDGSERFYESQLTIPGVMNVEGGSLFGVPLVLIGHTDNLAWSHTVSTGYRFTPFEETLVPGQPTTYMYDGQQRSMHPDEVFVTVKNPDGSLSVRNRTLWSTHHGPIFTSVAGQSLFPWTQATAFSMGDANAGNFRYLNHFLETNEAQSVSELDQILKRNQGIPWVNTLAADSSGKAYYADISVVPNVPDTKAATCDTALGAATFQALRLPVLDGSRSSCEWNVDADAVQPGTFGPSHMPSLFRDDFVENSNDSYWLTNPAQPLTGFAKIIGDEDTERALRTRSGLVMIEQRLNGTDGRPGNKFTLQQLQDTVFANRQYTGELWRDELVQMCNANPTLTGSNGQSVDVSAACPVLAAWDLHDNLDSPGAVLFRRFASRALAVVGLKRPPGIFREEYSSADPVHTPRGLNTQNPRVQQALADAVAELRSLGIPLDAKLRDYQSEARGSEKVPIHGGPGTLGVFNAINVPRDAFGAQGWTNVPHGSSYVYTAQFTGDNQCPVKTRSILTYSQSTNPNSPYFGDQTRMFSNKQWVDEAYCESEIAADPNLRVTQISSGYPRPRGATPLRVPLVPAYRQCSSPNLTHGPPLAFGSCSPPVQTSQDLTVGTPDANGNPAASVGSVLLRVVSCPPCANPLATDVLIDASITDVRNRTDLSAYTGSLQGRFSLRLTDHFNAAAAGDPQTDAATVQDSPFKFSIPCAATTGSSGGACQVNTSANAIAPGSVRNGDRAIWQLGAIGLHDSSGGLFATQGVFVP